MAKRWILLTHHNVHPGDVILIGEERLYVMRRTPAILVLHDTLSDPGLPDLYIPGPFVREKLCLIGEQFWTLR